MNYTMKKEPKGILISIGGAEDKGTDLEQGIILRDKLNFFEIGILKQLAQLIKSDNPRIEIITTASQIPEEVGQNYIDAFNKLGYKNVGVLDIRKREDTLKDEYIQRVKECDALMFSGGNQLRLSSIFGGTEILDIIKTKYYEEEFIIGGTSAGAMAMSRTMIYEGNASLAHLKGEVKITTGLGLVENVIIDSHFEKRGRFMRLAQAVSANPGAIGIGLGEDTGVVIRNGYLLEIVGSSCVTIIDGAQSIHSNIADIDFGEPLSIDSLKVHILSRGNSFNIFTKKFYITKEEMDLEDANEYQSL